MKLSFTLPKPSADHYKEFVTEFDPSKTLPDAPSSLLIPPKPNEWRPYKKMKNLHLPLQSDGSRHLQFEMHSSDPPLSSSPSQISYGLNLRSKADADDQKGTPLSPALQRLREDLKNLHDEPGFEEFEDVPVEGFAKALLAGYGWREGMGVGKNAKEDVKVKQYQRWTGKEGLGSSFKENLSKKERVKEDEDGLSVGKDLRVIQGIREVKDSKHKMDERRKDGKRSREGERRSETKGQAERVRRSNGDRGVSWLSSHIRVRIISKDLKGGRLYLKKGQVVDVVGPYMCDISMDESRELIRGVEQELLETALPRRGGPVLVLCGRYKGVYGSLEERDLDRETGVVRDAHSHELLTVKLDQIAEYMGDPSYLGC